VKKAPDEVVDFGALDPGRCWKFYRTLDADGRTVSETQCPERGTLYVTNLPCICDDPACRGKLRITLCVMHELEHRLQDPHVTLTPEAP
jgi:hypothetical protein